MTLDLRDHFATFRGAAPARIKLELTVGENRNSSEWIAAASRKIADQMAGDVHASHAELAKLN